MTRRGALPFLIILVLLIFPACAAADAPAFSPSLPAAVLGEDPQNPHPATTDIPPLAAEYTLAATVNDAGANGAIHVTGTEQVRLDQHGSSSPSLPSHSMSRRPITAGSRSTAARLTTIRRRWIRPKCASHSANGPPSRRATAARWASPSISNVEGWRVMALMHPPRGRYPPARLLVPDALGRSRLPRRFRRRLHRDGKLPCHDDRPGRGDAGQYGRHTAAADNRSAHDLHIDAPNVRDFVALLSPSYQVTRGTTKDDVSVEVYTVPSHYAQAPGRVNIFSATPCAPSSG